MNNFTCRRTVDIGGTWFLFWVVLIGLVRVVSFQKVLDRLFFSCENVSVGTLRSYFPVTCVSVSVTVTVVRKSSAGSEAFPGVIHDHMIGTNYTVGTVASVGLTGAYNIQVLCCVKGLLLFFFFFFCLNRGCRY